MVWTPNTTSSNYGRSSSSIPLFASPPSNPFSHSSVYLPGRFGMIHHARSYLQSHGGPCLLLVAYRIQYVSNYTLAAFDSSTAVSLLTLSAVPHAVTVPNTRTVLLMCIPGTRDRGYTWVAWVPLPSSELKNVQSLLSLSLLRIPLHGGYIHHIPWFSISIRIATQTPIIFRPYVSVSFDRVLLPSVGCSMVYSIGLEWYIHQRITL